SRTRSDVCHIGFVLATTLLVLVALASGPLPHARVFRVARHGFAALVGLLLAASLTIWLNNARVSPPPLQRAAIDPHVAGIWQADVIAAMTDVNDRVYVAPLGGVQYLLARRDNVTAFNLLVDGPYSAGQWSIAAAQIVERKPRLIHASRPWFSLLVK